MLNSKCKYRWRCNIDCKQRCSLRNNGRFITASLIIIFKSQVKCKNCHSYPTYDDINIYAWYKLKHEDSLSLTAKLLRLTSYLKTATTFNSIFNPKKSRSCHGKANGKRPEFLISLQ